MLKLWEILILLAFCSTVAFGQQLLPANSNDCKHAIILKDSLFGLTSAPKGSGEIVEFSGNNIYSSHLFEKEHNTVWYEFKVPINAVELSIDIVPVDIRDDYDFILYSKNELTCEQILTKKTRPIRSCISRNDKSINSCTGLSSFAQKQFVDGGINDSYCKSLSVKAGETYLLALDNVYPKGKGHTIKLHYKYENIFFPVAAVPLLIEVIDASSKKSLIANVEITQAKNNEYDTVPQLKINGKSNYLLPLEMSAAYKITCYKEGYTVQTERILTKNNKDTLNQKFQLSKLEVGTKLTFDKIYFVGNAAEFLPVSMPALKDLLNTMQKNKTLTIIIYGHVNGPKAMSDPPEYFMDLSLRRAKAVYDYLAENGIASERLAYKGFGNTKMIFPNPMGEAESAANRRVEIFIVK